MAWYGPVNTVCVSYDNNDNNREFVEHFQWLKALYSLSVEHINIQRKKSVAE